MSDTKLEKILIIDDHSDYRKLIKTFINKLLPGVEIIEYDPVFEGVPDDAFNWSEIDVLLLDYHLSIVGTTGLDILHKHHKKTLFPATIMLTAAGTEEIAIRALKLGIYEYQPKQSLTKDKLKQSIIHAWEEKKSDRKKIQEITQHNRSFSKEVFYETLEKAFNPRGAERVLVVIKPDDINILGKEIGIIGRDNLVNHIAKNSFEVFKSGACNPNITRISDTEIGIQIDFHINMETLEFNMQGLCKHLAKCTFKFSEKKYTFSVSIGVLKLGVFNKPAEQLIYIASAAAYHASKFEGNSYYIWKDTNVAPEFIENNETYFDNKSFAQALEPTDILKEEPEAAILAGQETQKALEIKLKMAEEAKGKAESALKLANEKKLGAELKAQAELRAAQEKTKVPVASLEEIETQIRRLINEKKIIQTYQHVTAMFNDDDAKEIYKTGLQATIEEDNLNEYLSDISIFSTSLQQTINEWILRQVFLRITESGTTKCQYQFLINVTESWFSDITLFNWLQKILSQTKKYNPGKSIILDVPLDIFNKYQKRAKTLINILHKSHQFTIALSNIHTVDNISECCASTSSKLLMVNIERLKNLTSSIATLDIKEEDGKQNMLQYLKENNIRIITSGIEDSTLLTDAITAGTDYTLGNFVGEIQNNLLESSAVESFELI